MLQYMLDTNICIYVMKRYPEHLRGRFERHREQICISSITLAELHSGAERSTKRAENLETIERFASRLEVLPFSASAAAHHGQIRADLARRGKLAGPYDMLVGAHARAEGLVVVTNNVREFAHMPGVRVENWA